MHILPSFRRSATLAGFALPLSLFLSTTAFAATLHIEQKSDIESVGKWTLLQPSDESLEGTERTMTLEAAAGKYVLIANPPEGMNGSIELKVGADVIQKTGYPQMSFELGEGDNYTLVITYVLTNIGRVGVNSDPAGIPFELRGPNSLVKKGVTPAAFEHLAIGNYSVRYAPKGCPSPAPKSDMLDKDGSIYFSITIKCDTFEAVDDGKKEANVTAELDGGETVSFSDVPKGAWFSAFVSTVARRGILTGYRDESGVSTGIFGPEKHVTLAELVKVAHEMADIVEEGTAGSPENTSAIGQWFSKYVSSAEHRGWLLYLDPTTDLARPATRGEVLVTLYQALDLSLVWPKGKTFSDVSVRTPYANAIETAAKAGIVSGSTDASGAATGLFHPENAVTRAELAKILIEIQEKYQRKSASSFSPN